MIKLRDAKVDDIEIYYNWVNDNSVRINSISSNNILWEDHKVWFHSKFNSENSYLFIAEQNSTPIGQVRFDYEKGAYFIDYSIDKLYRGKGYGKIILIEAIARLANIIKSSCTILGVVKKDNTPSVNVFNKIGFNQFETKYESGIELITYKKIINDI